MINKDKLLARIEALGNPVYEELISSEKADVTHDTPKELIARTVRLARLNGEMEAFIKIRFLVELMEDDSILDEKTN